MAQPAAPIGLHAGFTHSVHCYASAAKDRCLTNMILQRQQRPMQLVAYAGHVFLFERHWLLPHQVLGILNDKNATID